MTRSPIATGWLPAAALALVLAGPAAASPPASPETAPAAAPAATGAAEIEHLLAYVAGSGCRFERNGRWHAADRAAAHLRRKLPHYTQHARPPTAEGFIRHVATASSLSGKPYRVRCGDTTAEPLAAWLERELARHRAPPGP